MEKEFIRGLMVMFIEENTLMTNVTDMESISLQTKPLMKDNGAKTYKMVKVHVFLKTKADMLALGGTIIDTARARSLLQQALFKLEIGLKVTIHSTCFSSV